jgi:7-keto-8-aminopelargonate synthetase-like enzyme
MEMSIEKMGVVLTRTVAFNIVVSFTADMKNMKCNPRKKPRTKRLIKFFLARLKLKDFLRTISITAKVKEAIIKRQKAMEKESRFCRNFMKIDAVPKRTPAVIPSVSTSLLVLTCISTVFSYELK